MTEVAPLGRAVKRTGPLLGAVGCVLGFVLVCAVFVWTSAGQQLDQRLAPRYRAAQDGVLFEPARAVLSFIGDPLVLAAVLGGVLVIGILAGRVPAALAGLAVAGCSIVGARVLKLMVSRPYLDVPGSTTHNSFPSGHVAAVAGVVCAVLVTLPARARWWGLLPGLIIVAMVGAATMIAGWHRLSDVLGAGLLAAALACAAIAVAEARRRV